MRTFVVDTHALVWFLAHDSRLSEKARTVLQDPTVRLIIPAIVLAEIKYLSSKGRFAQTLDMVRKTAFSSQLSAVSNTAISYQRSAK